MIELTYKEFMDADPCNKEFRGPDVEHLFPLTTAEDVREVAAIWEDCRPKDSIKYYARNFAWLACRVFDLKRRKKYLAKASYTHIMRKWSDDKILDPNDDGSRLWEDTNTNVWDYVLELLREQEADPKSYKGLEEEDETL